MNLYDEWLFAWHPWLGITNYVQHAKLNEHVTSIQFRHASRTRPQHLVPRVDSSANASRWTRHLVKYRHTTRAACVSTSLKFRDRPTRCTLISGCLASVLVLGAFTTFSTCRQYHSMFSTTCPSVGSVTRKAADSSLLCGRSTQTLNVLQLCYNLLFSCIRAPPSKPTVSSQIGRFFAPLQFRVVQLSTCHCLLHPQT